MNALIDYHPVKIVSNIALIKKTLWLILFMSCLAEMVFFPSWANLLGCVVSLAATSLFFQCVFYIEFLRRYPLVFIAFLHLFCFMYLPLPMTLLDGNEMSHDLYQPSVTYLLQFVYYLVAVLAVLCGCRWSERNQSLNRLLSKLQYFRTPTVRQLWILCFIGWIPQLLMSRHQGTGDELMAGAGTLNIFRSLIYTPILLLFMPLMNGKSISSKQRRIVYVYIFALVIFMISTNSRSKMLAPLMVYGSCYVLQKLYRPVNHLWISWKKMILMVIAVLLIAGPISDMAFAMVVVRGERTHLSAVELLNKTWDTFSNKATLLQAKQAAAELTEFENKKTNSIDWREQYVSNIFLDRLCNYRVVDASIHHAFLAGVPNDQMQEDFLTQLKLVWPQPIVSFFFRIDKRDYQYSSMDLLYSLNVKSAVRGGYKVGGDVGLGLVVFGWLYYICEFFVYTVIFWFFANLVKRKRGTWVFSLFVLLDIYYSYFMAFQVAGGVMAHVTYLLWAFWIRIILLLIIYRFARFLSVSNR